MFVADAGQYGEEAGQHVGSSASAPPCSAPGPGPAVCARPGPSSCSGTSAGPSTGSGSSYAACGRPSTAPCSNGGLPSLSVCVFDTVLLTCGSMVCSACTAVCNMSCHILFSRLSSSCMHAVFRFCMHALSNVAHHALPQQVICA